MFKDATRRQPIVQMEAEEMEETITVELPIQLARTFVKKIEDAIQTYEQTQVAVANSLEQSGSLVTIDDEDVQDELRTELADYAHRAWSSWMDYLFEKAPPEYIHGHCTRVRELGDVLSIGRAVIPAELVRRWQRQAATAYVDLPKVEQASDIAEANKILAIICGDVS